MNKSRQREIILQVLKSTTSHPTADWIYEKSKSILPSLSLGTVYRNLARLEKNGDIIKVQGVFESDRYDGNPKRHAHLICEECGAVVDIELKPELDKALLNHNVMGDLYDYSLVYNGICAECAEKKNMKAI